MKKFLLLISFFFVCIFSFQYKHPQGDPSQFNSFVPPTPEETATHSGAAILDIDLELLNGKYMWKSEIPVDAENQLTISIISPIYEEMEVQILPPNESKLSNIHLFSKEIEEDFGIDGGKFPAHSFEFENPTKGIWQILITSTNKNAIQQLKKRQSIQNLPQGKLVVSNYSPYKIEAHATTLDTTKDEMIGFELRLIDDSTPKKLNSLLHDPIITSNLHVQLDVMEPDGKELVIEMNDNGLFGDRFANDGIYFGQFKADQNGRFISQMIVSGKDPKGNPLLRTTEIAFDVVIDNIDVTSAYANYDQLNQVFDIFLNVESSSLQKNEDAKTFKIWSEVWGQNSNNDMVPVAWISGLADLQNVNGKYVIGKIELNHRWIEKVGVKNNLELRNLRIRDLEWSIILEKFTSLPIQINQIPELLLSQKDQPIDVITEEMLYGWETVEYKNKPLNSSLSSHKLVLVHGYCAQSNPFPISEFTNAVQFVGGLGVSLSNDEFSRRLITFMNSQSEAATVIGHSQGGMVNTHTYHYYVTPLDKSKGSKERIIQTVGTPFQGCSLAGSAAGLGQIFGVGCGSNNDLSTSGAKSWLSDISIQSRSEVYFYFTQYATGGLINSCSTAANLILKWPNDGTTEVEFANLPYGNNQQGNPKKGWCHTTGMNHPPQCTDSTRNKEMDKLAN